MPEFDGEEEEFYLCQSRAKLALLLSIVSMTSDRLPER